MGTIGGISAAIHRLSQGTDWDASGYIAGADVTAFLAAWQADQVAGTLIADFNGDGVVNSTDVSDFVNAWFEQSAKGCG